jgi:D-sedoheptulose 7-phosphate isomerase
MSRVEDIFAAAAAAHSATLRVSAPSILQASEVIRRALESGAKILVFGNGGSAADSQHFAAELVNRYRADRRAYAAIALTTDTSILTSVANDSSYSRVFARQIEALGTRGDVALGISTSGRSPSVTAALEQARSQQLTTVGLLGSDPGAVRQLLDICITVCTDVTPRVQEVHRTILHTICELLEP